MSEIRYIHNVSSLPEARVRNLVGLDKQKVLALPDEELNKVADYLEPLLKPKRAAGQPAEIVEFSPLNPTIA